MTAQYTSQEANQICNTIVQQLCGGSRGRLVAMLGAKDFFYNLTDEGVAFQFKFKAKAKNTKKGRPNFCRVTYLAGKDLYRFELVKIGRAPSYKIVTTYELEDVYGDMLQNLFESETGLYLKLF